MGRRSRRPPVAVIDPSMTGLYVMIEGPDTPLIQKALYTKAVEWPKTLEGRLARFRSMAETLKELIRMHQPILYGIEGYAFGKGGKTGRVVTLGECGGIIRDRTVGYADTSVEVPPGLVKKFATGSGNANKIKVATMLARRYDRDFADDNEADCFGLLRLCQASVGYAEMSTDGQRSAVATLQKLIQQETL